MAEPCLCGNPARPRAPRRTVIVLVLAITGGLISGILMWAAATPPTQAILSGSATAALLFLDKIIK